MTQLVKIYNMVDVLYYGRKDGARMSLSVKRDEENGFVIPIFKKSPRMLRAKIAGLQDIYYNAPVEIEVFNKTIGFVTEDNSYVRTLLSKATHVIDGRRDGVEVALGGFPTQTVYALSMKYWDAAIKEQWVPVELLEEMKPAYSSVSFTRSGHATFVPANRSYTEVIKNMGVDVTSYLSKSDNSYTFNPTKVATRLRLSNSSAEQWGVFDNYTYTGKKEDKAYQWKEGEIHSSIYTLSDGEKEIRLEVMPEDFTVQTNESIYGPHFGKDEKVSFGEWEEEMERPATDGSIYLAKWLADESGQENESGFAVRIAQVVKGMAIVIDGLEKETGSDMILFGGSVKANLETYIEKNELGSTLLNKARSDKKSPYIMLGAQVATKTFNNELLEKSFAETRSLLKSIIALDKETLDTFLSLEETNEDEDLEKLMSGQRTEVLYRANPEAFLKDGQLRKSLSDFLLERTRKMEEGKSFKVTDSEWRHMIVDPYAILSYLKEGKMYIKREEMTRGIRRQSGFSLLNGSINSQKAVLYRFPFLHKYEARLLNAHKNSLFLNKEAYRWYNKQIRSGLMKGFMFYSLWDMEAEGQSGADFDGDQTVWSTNKDIVNQTEQYPLFLDYSRVWDNETKGFKTIEGCPFKEELTNNMIHFEELDSTTEEFLWEQTARLAMKNLKQNYVGLFTHASDTVTEMTSVNAEHKDELEKLNQLLAVAIRWEIDAAKHGAAFYDELSFLSFITEGASTINQIKEAEKEFGIHLSSFFA